MQLEKALEVGVKHRIMQSSHLYSGVTDVED
jgi:hypothetical protein